MTLPAVAYFNDRQSVLIGLLTNEYHASPSGTIVARQLRSGFTVALTLSVDGTQRLVRLSVADRPDNLRAWDRHREERAILLQHLGISHWTPEPVPDLSTTAWFSEPRLAQGQR